MMNSKRSPIAVVGVSALFPGSVNATGFWKDIVRGTDLMSDIPASHWLIEDYYDPDPTAQDKTYAKRGAFLPDIDFDPLSWGIPPSIVPATDTNQLLALIVARQVLEDAFKNQFESMDKSRMSVILGVTSSQELLGSMVSRLQRPVWVKGLRDAGLPEDEVQAACDKIASNYVEWQESTFPGLLGNVVAGRIANRLDLGGTNCVTDAACASTFSALSMGVNELHLGQSDVVICGGADTMNDVFMYMCFSKTPALSATGDCRPFSDKADGTMMGEGLGMVALKRLEDAERDGDQVYAVVQGVGSSSDGRAKSVYAPVADGQAHAVRRAYEQAGFGPDTVELLEAHGTGTKAGDAAEFEGLRMVFDESGREDRQWCSLGSVKSQIGHTKSAAGAAGLVKAIFALHHKVLPPTIKVDAPNPTLEIEKSPFNLTTRARPWIRDEAYPRRAGVSSFGFGGSNFHIALEEYSGPAKKAQRLRSMPSELVLITGDSPAAVAAEAASLAKEAGEPGMLAYLARRTQKSFDASKSTRLATVAEDEADLVEKLAKAAEQVKKGEAFSTPFGIHFDTGAHEGEVAFLFPGQGSQYIDMGAGVAMHHDDARAAWDAAAGLGLARDAKLHDVVFPRSTFDDEAKEAQTDRLRATEWAQPAIGAASLALLQVVRNVGLKPAAVGGHSFGEVTALHAAGVFSADDMLRVARKRGELMGDAAQTPGSMTAVSAKIEDLHPLLDEWKLDVVVANHNSPEQVVLSGPTDAIDRLEVKLNETSIESQRLVVATAFHSHVVSPSVAPFKGFLDSIDFASPNVTVYSNAAAAPYPREPAAIRTILGEQIASSVRFVEQIEAMYAQGVRTFIEVGPGSVLTGLVGRILEGRPHRAINLDRRGRDGITSLHHGLGRLAVAGLPLQLASLWEDYPENEDPRTTTKPKLLLKLNGTNYGKLYPPPGGAAALPKPNPKRAVPVSASVPASVPASAPALASAPVAAPAPSPLHGPAVGAEWLAAYQSAQEQTASAHAAYQRSMAEAHTAFLKSAEASVFGLATMAMQPGATAAVPVSVSVPAPVAAPVPAPVPTPVAVPAPVPAPVAASVPVSVSAAPDVDLQALMLDVVAEKTGYPADMLNLEMDLEADLGVDSIKRVEILSTMYEKAPSLPEVDAGEMAQLRTLAQIVDYMNAQMSAGAPASAAPAAPGVDLKGLMLEVVAEKTGYPADMLNLEMDLEADLGVDSIKRVEILSTMYEKAPSLPEVDAGEMAQLRTLAQIVDYMNAQMGGAPTSVASRPASAPVAEIASPKVGRYPLRVVDAPALGFALSGLCSAQKVVVTDDGSGIAPLVATQLADRGVAAEVVSKVTSDADAVLFLGGLREAADIDHAKAVNREAFLAAKSVAARFADRGGVFVTVQDTGGDFGVSGSTRAWLGGLSGLVKTAAQEWPQASLRAIDIERGDRGAKDVAAAIVEELLAGGDEVEAGLLADGTRTTLESFDQDVTAGAAVVNQKSVILASGGARGVTAATLIALAGKTGARFVLLGRTPLQDEPASIADVEGDAALKQALLSEAKAAGEAIKPAELGKRVSHILANREVRATVAAIKAAGGDARYVAADVKDTDAIRAGLEPVRAEWGPVTGIVHGAGLLADKLIAEKTEDQFDLVFDTKVDGLCSLLSVTRDDDLEVLCLFSSVAARCGNQGQCDYAMANEVLNKVAAAERKRRGGKLIVKSLNWGPWEGGMVTPALKARFEALGVPLIPLATGAQMLVDELTRAAPEQTEICLGGEPRPGALLSEGRDETTVHEVLVDRASYPYLDGHRVNGETVVPIVLVLEWFARAARARRPDLSFIGCSDVKVLKGVRLPDFDKTGKVFRIRSRQFSNGSGVELALELIGPGDVKHYSATASLSPAPAEPKSVMPSIGSLEAYGGEVYGGVLFHGPEFQAIRQLEGISTDGIAAELVGATTLGWHGQSWQTDPALLDGGLQLAVLWTKHTLGGASLPTSVDHLRIYRSGLPEGELRCVLVCKKATGDKAVCDVAFVDADGGIVAELAGVTTHVLPGSRSSSDALRAGA